MRTIPKSFWKYTDLTGLLSITYVSEVAEKFFPQIERSVHSESLNVRFQLELQVQSAVRSSCRVEESEFFDMLLQHCVVSKEKQFGEVNY